MNGAKSPTPRKPCTATEPPGATGRPDRARSDRVEVDVAQGGAAGRQAEAGGQGGLPRGLEGHRTGGALRDDVTEVRVEQAAAEDFEGDDQGAARLVPGAPPGAAADDELPAPAARAGERGVDRGADGAHLGGHQGAGEGRGGAPGGALPLGRVSGRGAGEGPAAAPRGPWRGHGRGRRRG